MKIWGFLKGLPLTVHLVVGGLALAGGWLAIHDYGQRQAGAERILREQADSIARVAVARAKTALEIAEKSIADAAALRAQARAEVAKDAAVIARADAAIATAAGERDAARRLLEDSMATVAQLRVQVDRLITTGAADAAAHATERTQLLRTKASLLATMHADSLALMYTRTAVDRMRERAEAAERRADLGKPARVGLLSRCGAIVGYGGVLAGKTVHNGPGVTLGCKVFPWNS